VFACLPEREPQVNAVLRDGVHPSLNLLWQALRSAHPADILLNAVVSLPLLGSGAADEVISKHVTYISTQKGAGDACRLRREQGDA
jgi:hypothetical protein